MSRGEHRSSAAHADTRTCTPSCLWLHSRVAPLSVPRSWAPLRRLQRLSGWKEAGDRWASPLGSQAQCLQTWGPHCPPAVPRALPGPPAWPSTDFRCCRGHPPPGCRAFAGKGSPLPSCLHMSGRQGPRGSPSEPLLPSEEAGRPRGTSLLRFLELPICLNQPVPTNPKIESLAEM